VADPERSGDIEIEQDLRFQRLCWKLERGGWAFMTLLIVAAVLGLFGSGPLSHRIAGEKGGPLWVEYQRFGRWDCPEELHVHLGPGVAREGKAMIWVSRELIELHDVEHVTPPPEAVEAHGDGYTYVFRVPAAAEEVSITFNLKPESWGPAAGSIGVAGGAAVAIRQFVYP
jgi:hypothetical protein